MCVYAIKIFMYALKLFKMEEVERERKIDEWRSKLCHFKSSKTSIH